MSEATLYQRLGGYDAIAAVCADLLPRLQADEQLGRFWKNRGEDGLKREYQLLVDFICNAAGGPLYYTGRDMVLTHKGMRISSSDWDIFMRNLDLTLDKFALPAAERADVVAFIESTRADMVEA
jgi:hemoglobin